MDADCDGHRRHRVPKCPRACFTDDADCNGSGAAPGLRQGELLPLEKRHLTDEGIDMLTANTHKRLIIEWNPELRGVIDRAFDISSRVRQFVICNREGKRYTSDGLRTIWD
jgi:hypothetical protein